MLYIPAICLKPSYAVGVHVLDLIREYIIPKILSYISFAINSVFLIRLEGRGSSVCRVLYSWWRGPGFDSRCGRPRPTVWVGVSIM